MAKRGKAPGIMKLNRQVNDSACFIVPYPVSNFSPWRDERIHPPGVFNPRSFRKAVRA